MTRINADEIRSVIKQEIAEYQPEIEVAEVGKVLEVGDGIARIYGLEGALASQLLEFPGGIKGMVQHISLRSVKLRHPRGMVFTIPFGDMGAVQNFSRDYIITKLDVRVRYDADVEKIRKIVKRIGKELEQDEEIGPVLLSPIKSQGVREMDDSAMILRRRLAVSRLRSSSLSQAGM